VQAEVGPVAVGDLAHPAADLQDPETEGIELKVGGLGLGE
jgi:hypothetical protein